LKAREARDTLSLLVESWPEPWAYDWAEAVVAARTPADFDSQAVEGLIVDVRRLLDHLDQMDAPSVSRTELAAKLFGSSHALDERDKEKKLAGAVTQALQFRERDFRSEKRALWEKAGILSDRVSAPVLSWSIPTVGGSALDEQIRAASAGGLPVHVSLFALQKHPIGVPQNTQVLVVENPRLVEAAAERGMPGCVITSNGNPSSAVTTLLQQLRESGASIWYHGDFDTSGIGICRRMCKNADATPWMMDASHYEAAIDLAGQKGIRLERDAGDCGATPWDPALRVVFRRYQRVIHEESVLDDVLSGFSKEQR